jgi:hypothetical protein
MSQCAKCVELARILIEARDALPALNMVQLRLHNIDLTLCDRIDAVLKPWVVPDGTPGAI